MIANGRGAYYCGRKRKGRSQRSRASQVAVKDLDQSRLGEAVRERHQVS
jgi:hypothetical protein